MGWGGDGGAIVSGDTTLTILNHIAFIYSCMCEELSSSVYVSQGLECVYRHSDHPCPVCKV